MATQAIPGFKGTLYLATSSSGGTLAKYGELQEVTLVIKQAAMDAFSKDSSGWKEFLAGVREWDLTGTGLYILESSDAGQKAIMAQLAGQFLSYVQLREATTAGTPSSSGGTAPQQLFTGMGLFTDFTIGSPLEKPADTKFSFKGTGAITVAAATS